MKHSCPNLNCAAPDSTGKDGFFRRKDDSKYIQRYRCNGCGLRFSSATLKETFRQKRRRINSPLLKLLASGNSQRRCAILLGINRKTVERRLPFLARRCRGKNDQFLNEMKGRIHNIQIDDLITKENSKLKTSLRFDCRRRR
jgi:transposase-like protein